jgi:hypothetical protein
MELRGQARSQMEFGNEEILIPLIFGLPVDSVRSHEPALFEIVFDDSIFLVHNEEDCCLRRPGQQVETSAKVCFSSRMGRLIIARRFNAG